MKFALLIFGFVFSFLAPAKIEPYNYDFSADTLADFFPGKDVSALEAKYSKPEILQGDAKRGMLRFMVAQIRYVFPVVVQVDQGKILDMHARLPSYFLHDIFHHTLIKRWGKQQVYQRVDEEAYYGWKSDEFEMDYNASCTITCFPTSLNVRTPASRAPAYTPIAQQLRR